MLFDSFQFAVFFPVVCGLFFVLPHRFRWLLLLVASYYFYMSWRPVYALLLVLITAIDFSVGILLARAARPTSRRAILLASLGANLGILFFFKYYDFAAGSLNSLTATAVLPELGLVLPIGLSFHTFQSMGYTVDVYRRKVEPERNWRTFANFIIFFPQLVAGPIERASDLMPQLRRFHDLDYERITNGLKLMAWGLFKKVVVADRLAQIVDPMYAEPYSRCGPLLLLSSAVFGYQIYCDFSGYSDMAIGAAEVLGVRLMTNFRAPYHARSLRDFWTRWHISLSTWFRDYVYIPLGGNHVRSLRWAFNILIVFALSGMWHGARWTFLIWGLHHGLLLIVSRFTQGIRAAGYRLVALDRAPRILAALETATTFWAVMIGWVYFRAPSLEVAGTILGRIVTNWQPYLMPEYVVNQFLLYERSTSPNALIALAGVIAVEIGDSANLHFPIRQWLSARPPIVRWSAYYVLIITILLCGKFEGAPFIYFQF
jgi:alginate O-acetyltransferase complex protein AlgI